MTRAAIAALIWHRVAENLKNPLSEKGLAMMR
jgi:hypothetical protein